MARNSPQLQAVFAALRRAAYSLALLPHLIGQHGWVAETPGFRVLVQQAPGLDADTAAAAANDLEAIRLRLKLLGLGLPRRADGPVEFLVVANRLDLHALIQEPPASRTRGITIRGTDRDLTIVAWLGDPGPRVTLAHEYAHHLDDNRWPLWFREGRAVFLARGFRPRSGEDPVKGLAALLDRSAWIGWHALLAATRNDPVVREDHFQAQAWLLVHWLSSRQPSLASLMSEHGELALSELGEEGLTQTLRTYLAHLLDSDRELPVEPSTGSESATGRPAAPWEIPLFKAKARRALRFLDTSEAGLTDLIERYPQVARIHTAYALLQLVRGRQDLAEEHLGRGLRLGDDRARTAYRYAVLLMRPGPIPRSRADRALRFALEARDKMPAEPEHQLAVVHAQMLREDWTGAFSELGRLAGFAGWGQRADREAREIQRRRGQALTHEKPPTVVFRAPTATLPPPSPSQPPAWKDRSAGATQLPRRKRWPPYGAWLTHGRVAWIDCSGGEKRLILHSPYKRYVFRENPSRPPSLINRPFREKNLPCESRGWKVAVAYRKDSADREVDGELVGIRF